MCQLAQFQLSTRTWGRIQPNHAEARRWLELAASRGDAQAIIVTKKMRTDLIATSQELKDAQKEGAPVQVRTLDLFRRNKLYNIESQRYEDTYSKKLFEQFPHLDTPPHHPDPILVALPIQRSRLHLSTLLVNPKVLLHSSKDIPDSLQIGAKALKEARELFVKKKINKDQFNIYVHDLFRETNSSLKKFSETNPQFDISELPKESNAFFQTLATKTFNPNYAAKK